MDATMPKSSKLFPASKNQFTDHPKFPGVQIAVLVNGRDTDTVSVSQLVIGPGIEIPIHTHDPQVDSIYIVSGKGEAYVNGQWCQIVRGDYLFFPAGVGHATRNTGGEPLILFVHHSPPLL